MKKAHQELGMGIESYLIMPVQRLPRIEMLLKDLLRHTTEDHPDFKPLSSAYEGILSIANFVNEKKREAENFSKMAAVQRKLGSKVSPPHFIQYPLIFLYLFLFYFYFILFRPKKLFSHTENG